MKLQLLSFMVSACVVGAELLPLFAQGQEQQDSIKTIKFAQGALVTDYLPYSRKFRIKGDTNTPSGPADAVHLKISLGKEVDGQTQAAEEKQQICWERSTAEEKEFVLVVNPLEVNKEYYLQLTFLKKVKKEKIKHVKTKVLEELVKEMSSQASEAINTENVNTILRRNIQSIFGLTDPQKFYDLKRNNEKCELITHETHGELNDKQNELLKQFRRTAAMTYLSQLLNKDASELSELRTITDGGPFKQIVTQLENAIQAGTAVGFTQQDVDQLKKAGETPEAIPDLYPKFTKLLANPPAQVTGNLEPLRQVFSYLDKIRRNAEFIKSARSKLQKEQTVLDKSFRETLNVPDLETGLKELFIVQSAFHLTDYAWADETQLREILVGTAYGFATVPLGLSDDDADYNTASYVALKFYLPWVTLVDKDLPDPFFGRKFPKGVSLLVGSVAGSELAYKGQQQDKISGLLGLNVRLMLGLSLDVSRYVSINGGVVLFQQPSANPLSDRTRTRGTPFLGVSFDLNVFNELNQLINPSQAGSNN